MERPASQLSLNRTVPRQAAKPAIDPLDIYDDDGMADPFGRSNWYSYGEPDTSKDAFPAISGEG
jgi:hypothetical protein